MNKEMRLIKYRIGLCLHAETMISSAFLDVFQSYESL